MSTTVSRRTLRAWGRRLRSSADLLSHRLSLRGRIALVQRGGHAVEDAVGHRALGQQRQRLVRRVRREDRDAVRVGAEPGARLRDVVGDEQVDALAAELVRRAFERARLGGEPDEDRARPTGTGERGRGGGRPRRGGPASARARASGPRRASSFESAARAGRKSATAAAMTRASAPVDDRSSTASRIWAVVSTRMTVASAGSGTADMPGDERHPRPAGERRLGDGDAHLAGRAVADEPDRVDRLGRAAGGDRRRAGRRGPRSRGGSTQRRASARVRRHGPAGRRPPRRRRRRCAGSSASRPTPDLARRERARRRARRSCSRSRPAAARRSPGSRGATTSRRPSPARRRPAPTSRARSRSPRRPRGRWPSRPASGPSPARRRAHPRRRRRTMWPIRPSGSSARTSDLDRVPAQRLERQRRDEPRRGRRQEDDDVGALGLEQADQLDGLVGGDRAGDAERDQPALEAAAHRGARRRHRSSPSSSGSPPPTSAWRIARPLSVSSGSIASTPRAPRAHGAAESPPVRIARTSAGVARPPRRRARAGPARAGPVDQRLVAEDRARLHRAHRVAPDRPVRAAQLDPRQLGRPRRERLEAQLQARRDRPADERAVGRHAVDRRRGPEVDDDGRRAVEPVRPRAR